MNTQHRRSISENRKALRDYEILERIEAGIVLAGTEIKSIRSAKVNLQDSYARVSNGEMWLFGMHVAAWTGGGPWNHDPIRPRKLLLHHNEIFRLSRASGQKGLTLIPLRLYLRDHHAKIEIGLAKGRRQYDKRKVIMQREVDRELARTMRRKY